MICINLVKEERYDNWDRANARFHNRFQFCCIVVMAMMFVLLFIYGL
jgi:hypothetical protein